MTHITPKIRQAIEQAGDVPARLVDPSTGAVHPLRREHEFAALAIDWRGELPLTEQDGLIRETGHRWMGRR